MLQYCVYLLSCELISIVKGSDTDSPLVKSVYQKNNFLISQPNYMLWVIKRTVSMRRFWAPQTYVETDG